MKCFKSVKVVLVVCLLAVSLITTFAQNVKSHEGSNVDLVELLSINSVNAESESKCNYIVKTPRRCKCKGSGTITCTC